jgi:hypothetical protein
MTMNGKQLSRRVSLTNHTTRAAVVCPAFGRSLLIWGVLHISEVEEYTSIKCILEIVIDVNSLEIHPNDHSQYYLTWLWIAGELKMSQVGAAAEAAG